MRYRSLVVAAVAAAATTGCASSSPREGSWERLCARLTCDAPGPRAPAPAPLSPQVSRELVQASARIRGSVVRIERTPVKSSGSADTGLVTAASVAAGSGTVIRRDGLVLTNAHVVAGSSRLAVVLYDGTRYPVVSCALDPNADLAILRVATDGLTSLLPDPRAMENGSPVVALAGAGVIPATASRAGVVTQTKVSLPAELDPSGRRRYEGLLESSAAIERGFSGGPVLDGGGRFIGVSVALRHGADNVRRAYAIPFNGSTLPRVERLVAEASKTGG